MITKSFPTLYKKTGSGVVQQWSIWVTANGEFGVINVEHGQYGGKLQTGTDTVTQGKNVGKKNETSPFTQAVAEAEAKWTKKIDREGYVDDLIRAESGETDVEGGLFPMLAKTLEDVPEKKRKWPYDYQRKFNGVRCLVEVVKGKVTLWSRKHKRYLGVPHIQKAYEEIFKDAQGPLTFDGEIYRHGWSLQKISGYVRKDETKPGFEELGHFVYDLPVCGESSNPWKLRKEALATIFADRIGNNHPNIHAVETISIDSEEAARAQEKKWVAEGYEGGILRDRDGKYESGKRSYGLMKVKSFKEQEFPIIAVKTGRGKFEGLAMFTCVTDEGKEFDCTAPGDFEDRAQFLRDADKLIGKKLTVKFFEWTEDGKPSHGVGAAVRDYE